MEYNLHGTIERIFTPNFETFKSNICHLLHDNSGILKIQHHGRGYKKCLLNMQK